MPEPQSRLPGEQQCATTSYSEQETVQYSRLEVHILHQLVEAGVVGGMEVVGEAQRRYDAADLALLRRVRRLYHDLGVNPEGIEIIVRLSERIQMLQHEIARYQGSAEPWGSGQPGHTDSLDQPESEEQRSS